VIKGSSAWFPPIHPKIKKLAINNQKKNLIIGLKALLRILEISRIGNAKNIRIAANIPTTPNNLSGIDLKIA